MADRRYLSEGDSVRWESEGEWIVGTIVNKNGPYGRLIVKVDGEDLLSHIQPSFVEVVPQ